MRERYQDYVIRDGKFVGEFEDMYKKFPDPWLQSNKDNLQLCPTRNYTSLLIKKYNIKSLIEFGCGLGKTTNMLSNLTNCQIVGVDISETAIAKAKASFPHLDFEVGTVEELERFSQKEAVLFAELTWYILPQLSEIFIGMKKHLKGKYFIHNLVFYKGDLQKYGRDYFTNLDEFIEKCPFKLLDRAEFDSTEQDTIKTTLVFEI